ncbi:MAG: hypothetical protein K8R16_00185 [Anaerolineales bacterium]|nr:hypothetical protein [Anaerolineales bacterium]
MNIESQENAHDLVMESLMRLDSWIERNGWEGHDPYDIKGTKLFLSMGKIKYLGFAANIVTDRFPGASRKVFGVKKEINAKAMGLFASGYLNLYKCTGDKKYFEKAQYCLDWLEKNLSKGYSGYCWGYPFDWQSRIFIPRGTPSSVVTTMVANAFLDMYEESKDDRYLRVAESSCEFIVNDLNIDYLDGKRICFSYTPLDTYHVHNANLFSAALLCRVGNITKNNGYIDMSMKALQYTLGEQNSDGSWYYWGPPDKLLYNIDHYHTGFVLRALYEIYKITGEITIKRALDAGFRYYTNNLFENGTVPKLKNTSKYPIDIHSCSEAILCLSTLSDEYIDAKEIVSKVVQWIIDNMQDKDGYFYYRMYKNRVHKMPYIRWGQAWMLSGLSLLESH